MLSKNCWAENHSEIWSLIKYKLAGSGDLDDAPCNCTDTLRLPLWYEQLKLSDRN